MLKTSLGDRYTEVNINGFLYGLEKQEDVNYIFNQISMLPRVGMKFVVCDFDDTLFSRDDQLQLGVFQDNRGIKGIQYIKNEFGGYDHYVDHFYKQDIVISELVQKIRDNLGMLLTAGNEVLQFKKIVKTGLQDIHTNVVKKAYQKPIALLKTIIKMGYIPSEIDIYEDRPEYFDATGKMLADLLGSKINVHKVTLNRDKIDNIETISYGEVKPIVYSSIEQVNSILDRSSIAV